LNQLGLSDIIGMIESYLENFIPLFHILTVIFKIIVSVAL
jgi:hypothetical protein